LHSNRPLYPTKEAASGDVRATGSFSGFRGGRSRFTTAGKGKAFDGIDEKAVWIGLVGRRTLQCAVGEHSKQKKARNPGRRNRQQLAEKLQSSRSVEREYVVVPTELDAAREGPRRNKGGIWVEKRRKKRTATARAAAVRAVMSVLSTFSTAYRGRTSRQSERKREKRERKGRLCPVGISSRSPLLLFVLDSRRSPTLPQHGYHEDFARQALRHRTLLVLLPSLYRRPLSKIPPPPVVDTGLIPPRTESKLTKPRMVVHIQ
jgi:hypothetical protein